MVTPTDRTIFQNMVFVDERAAMAVPTGDLAMHQTAPEAPPVEPEVEPRRSQPEEPSRKTEPDPFNPDWPDDLPEPPPKA